MLVDIYYDLIDPDSNTVFVGVEMSSDGGATYAVPFNDISGNLGFVVPGSRRHIEWNAWNDWPNQFTTRARVRLTVEDPFRTQFPPPFPPPMPNLVWIPPGTFTMGSPANEQDRFDNEGPQTQVWISRGFFMGRTEVTQREYQEIMNTNPSYFQGNLELPVEQVSWWDVTSYCTQLTQREQALGRLPVGYVYRLPTEAEWEYACRGGRTTRFCYGDDPGYTELWKYAWYSGNSESKTHQVGTRLLNGWGLCDMHGNVWEWCQDWYGDYYSGGAVTDPKGPGSGSNRVIRGGSWSLDPLRCRSANRCNYFPDYRYSDLGFRVVLGSVP